MGLSFQTIAFFVRMKIPRLFPLKQAKSYLLTILGKKLKK